MRYVILRDDDTNALTPTRCLETLYRPFLDRGFPVNLAVIPEVDVNTRIPDGTAEGYLFYRNGEKSEKVAIGSNAGLISYFKENPHFHVLQHGCHHDYLEFDCQERAEAATRIERGSKALTEAGFPNSQTFVAPYDRLSRASFAEVASRFRVLSTGWFELRRLPCWWWPKFAAKKIRKTEHWRVGQTALLSHPGCILSCHRPTSEILPKIVSHVGTHRLTVLVTHWWEYFRDGRANEPLIGALHETAAWLAQQTDVTVISFDDLARDPVSYLV